MEELKYCRACLAMDVMMYNLNSESLGEIYSQLLEVSINFDKNQHLCYECAKLLYKFAKFKSKCLRAHNVLSRIEFGAKVMTRQDLQNIDRQQNKLVSDIKFGPVVVCRFDSNDNSLKEDIETVELPLKEEHNEFYIYNEIQDDDNKSFEEKPKLQTLTAKLTKPVLCCDKVSSKNKTNCKQRNGFRRHINKLSNDTQIKTSKLSNAKKNKSKSTHLKPITSPKSNVCAESLHQKSVPSSVINTRSSLQSHTHITCEDEKHSNVIAAANFNSIEKPHIPVPTLLLEPIDKRFVTIVCNTNCDEFPTNNATDCVESQSNLKLDNLDEDSFNLSDDEPLTSLTKANQPKIDTNKESSEPSKDYSVVWLTMEDAKNEILLRKQTNNYKLSPHKCDICFKGFLTLKTFENHMKRHNVECGAFECGICHIRYSSKDKLREHTFFCHERRFVCSFCPTITNNTTQAKSHAISHKEKFPCKVCGKLYGMSHSLISHMKTQHPEQVDETVCEFCGNVFFSPRGLRIHQLRSHTQENNDKQGPKCETCGVHFCSEGAWKLHLVMSSKHKAGNGCKTCGETFSSPEELRAHNKIHPHQPKCRKSCRLCGIQFAQRNEYRAHVRAEHPEKAQTLLEEKPTPFMCDLCGKIYKNSTLLAYHIRKHTGERPYSCAECGKRFATQTVLKAHRAVHQRSRYECDDCGQLVTSKGNLIRHKKAAHLNSRPHKCTLCDKRFVNRCDVKTHIKYSHNKVPWPKKKKRNDNEKVLTE